MALVALVAGKPGKSFLLSITSMVEDASTSSPPDRSSRSTTRSLPWSSHGSTRSSATTVTGQSLMEGAPMKRSGQCQLENCAQATTSRGMCRKHYERWRRHGDPNIRIKETPKQPRSTCTIPTCALPLKARGYCIKHYTRWRSHQDPNTLKHRAAFDGTCFVCGEPGPFFQEATTCIPCTYAKANQYRKDHHERLAPKERQKATLHRKRLRADVLGAYGGACSCCGETELVFLTLDHLQGGGTQHRRSLPGYGVYRWARQQGYPAGLFQVLCHNCNWAKYRGGCPHITEAKLDLHPTA